MLGVRRADLPDFDFTFTLTAQQAQREPIRSITRDIAGARAGDILLALPVAAMLEGFGVPQAYSVADGKVTMVVLIPSTLPAGTYSATLRLVALR